MSDLSCTSVTWRGLTLSGADDARFALSSLRGWEGLPGARRESPARPYGHGRFDGPVWADERIVTAGGACHSSTERDVMLAELGAVMTWGEGPGLAEDLVVEHGGRTLTAQARLTAYEPDVDSTWSLGRFPFAIEWRCPDPLRYGAYTSAPTTFPTRVGGLRFPLYSNGGGVNVGALDYGPRSEAGRATLTNEGTAASSPQFAVTGPIDPSGFEIVTVGTGARLVYAGAVPSGSTLVIDASSGAVLMDGESDRADLLTWRDWWSVPPGGSVEFAFIRLGSDVGGTPSLTASARPAFW